MKRSTTLKLLLPLFFIFNVAIVKAQLGKIDSLYYSNMGLGGACLGGQVLPDSTILIYGAFLNCNERVVNYIAKINQDGSNNYSFNAGSGANNVVTTVSRQSNGALVLGGYFSTFNGVTEHDIVRLNANGSIDTSFHTGTGNGAGFDQEVYATYLQPNGSIVVAGVFNSYNGVTNGGIVRLLSNGTRDTSFHCGTGANAGITAMTVQSNGQIIIGGTFTKYNGTTDTGVARLNSDGSLDTTFSLQRGLTPGKAIYALSATPGGKILVGGTFTTWAGQTANYIVRLNSDGTFDNTFSGGTGFNNYVSAITAQPNGQLVIGGVFTAYKGSTAKYIIRTDTSGNVDGTFSVGLGTNGQINSIFLNYNGTIFAGGTFSIEDSFARHNLVRLQSNGTIDQSFFYSSHLNADVKAMVTQSTGKVILAGAFTKFDSIAVGHILRLNTNGTLDTSFHTGIGANGNIDVLAITSSGQILVGGGFTQFNHNSVYNNARLNSDGSFDNTFTNNAINGTVLSFAFDKSNRIYVGGYWGSIIGATYPHADIARLSANGVLDNTFNPVINGAEYSIGIQSDGKVILGGGFTKCDNVTISALCRVDTLGNIDTATFHIGLSSTGINSVSLQPDGKILVGTPGSLSFNDTARSYTARVNTNGSLDNSFVANAGGYAGVYSIAYYNSGALIGGWYDEINSIAEDGIGLVDTFGNPNTTGYSDYNAVSYGSTTQVTDIYPDTVNGRILAAGPAYTTVGQLSNYFMAFIGKPSTSIGIDSVSIVAPVCARAPQKSISKTRKASIPEMYSRYSYPTHPAALPAL